MRKNERNKYSSSKRCPSSSVDLDAANLMSYPATTPKDLLYIPAELCPHCGGYSFFKPIPETKSVTMPDGDNFVLQAYPLEDVTRYVYETNSILPKGHHIYCIRYDDYIRLPQCKPCDQA